MEIKLYEKAPTAELLTLLLLADPDISKIESYFTTSQVFILEVAKQLAGVVVISPLDEKNWELKNLAVFPDFENQGFGQALLEKALTFGKAHQMASLVVKTGSTSFKQLYLYQKCGFRMKEIIPDYFTTHYSKKIFENGLWLKDQVILEYKDA